MYVLNAYLIPSSDKALTGFSWIGGSADRIDLDASQMSVDGEAICHHVIIQQISGLSGNINVINGSTRKWAVNGHYSLLIGDNGVASTRATYGTRLANVSTINTSTKIGSILAGIAGCLLFNSHSTQQIDSSRMIAISPMTNKKWFGAGYGVGITVGTYFNFIYTGSDNPNINDQVSITYSLYR